MGKSYEPTYRVEVTQSVRFKVTMGWDTKSWGRASAANLEKWVKTYNKSFQPGGVCAHLSEPSGIVPHIYKAQIVRQSNNDIEYTYNAPMFEVV